jgi:flagellar hook-associated protein 2
MGVNGIYGLSGSGIDIESMVKVGMMGKQKEYDKMAQKFTKNEWTKTALIDINSQLKTFNMSKL